MSKLDRESKQVRRLQLRREVIRVLADDSLARVHGGLSATCGTGDSDYSYCMPSRDKLP